LSLVDELPWEPESPWSMEATVEVVGSAVNRHLADTLAQRGRGLFRNQGLRDTDWPSHLEAYLRAEGVEVEHGRLATADDPVRTLDRLYWETENELVGGIYRMVRARRESLEEQRSSPDGGPLAVPQKADSPAWYAPVPFGHEDQEANAYARFTRPANNYSNIVNWRAVLEEELLSPVPLHSVAENLNQV
ncbi:MAG: hypothetical protein SVW02_00440, partial [Candidatus Nanohaloarchaea archaeon]|nr:hypothetical protein [Candidatus Nanohaloarchaea archaeon]